MILFYHTPGAHPSFTRDEPAFSKSQAAQASKIWHYRDHSSITAGGIQTGGSQSNTCAGHEQRDKHEAGHAVPVPGGWALLAVLQGNSLCSSIPAWAYLTLPALPGITCWSIPCLGFPGSSKLHTGKTSHFFPELNQSPWNKRQTQQM